MQSCTDCQQIPRTRRIRMSRSMQLTGWAVFIVMDVAPLFCAFLGLLNEGPDSQVKCRQKALLRPAGLLLRGSQHSP